MFWHLFWAWILLKSYCPNLTLHPTIFSEKFGISLPSAHKDIGSILRWVEVCKVKRIRDSDGRGQCKTRWSSHPPTESRFHLTTWLVSARQRGRMERGSSCSRRFSGMETGVEQIWFLSNVCLTGMAPSGYRWHHHCSFLNRLVHRSDVEGSQILLVYWLSLVQIPVYWHCWLLLDLFSPWQISSDQRLQFHTKHL